MKNVDILIETEGDDHSIVPVLTFFEQKQSLPMMRKVGFGANALRGTTYSIRCVIRGARKTGKTQLANLLRGSPFVSQYTPTATLQSCEIDMDINGITFLI